jgi:subtilisin family serine protease
MPGATAQTAPTTPAASPHHVRLPDLPPGAHRITLITGDRVTLDVAGGGRVAVEVRTAPRADGSKPIVEVEATKAPGAGTTVYAIPADARPYIASGQLDRELFNVSYLVSSGYGWSQPRELPVIVQYDADAAKPPAVLSESLPAVDVEASLGSIDAAADTVDLGRASALWSALTSGPDARSMTGDLGRRIDRVWLDEKIEIRLDESVPQIGAPAAWADGFDGTGIDVAVLDTGIDLAHPDVADQVIASRSFVDGQTVDDRHGHGTHVASIAAGTGAASGDRFTGVAPGADLIVGKVLANNGIGLESDAIEAMEWATQEQGADVVNMSFGSVPTDGTDLASQAVDEFTESTGALFVVAAGNLGPRSYSVAAPGTADAALTVGAVDGAGQMAPFSGRGPRVGKYTIKPEVVAPGVQITAARAAGTTLGVPFDASYSTASGTSMATPHVAGAAAILAQQHPDWTPEQLKAGLVATAVDVGHTVYQQGSGRIDVSRAVEQPLQVAPATGDFGLIATDDDAVGHRELTYRNPTAEPVTLELSSQLRTVGGEPAPDGALSLSSSAVTVPAGGSATVTVTLDPGELDSVAYTGVVTAATRDGPQLRTPVGVVVGEQQHSLHVDIVAKQGVAAFQLSSMMLVGVDGEWAGESISCSAAECPANLDFQLADGTYSVRALVAWNNASGVRQLGVLVDPEVRVSDDTAITLDANVARLMSVSTQRPTATRVVSAFGLFRSSSDGAFRNINSIFASATQDWWVTPTERVRQGDFAISSQWTLTPSTPAGQSPAYVYALKLTEWGRVPDSLAYQFRDRDLVPVENRYHGDQPGQPMRQTWFTWAPWEFAVGGGNAAVMSQTTVPEYVYPARPGFIHERGLSPGTGGLPFDETMDVYGPESRPVVEWNERPNAPGAVVVPDSVGREGLTAPLWWWVCAACRQGDNFYPFLHLTSSGERHTLGQYGRPFGFGETHLFRDGVEIEESPPLIGAFTTYTLPPDPATYRLTLDHGGSSTEWTFDSARPEQDAVPLGQECVETVFTSATTPCAPQPLLLLRYNAGVGLDNRVAADATGPIEVTAYRQDGRIPLLSDLQLSLSTDDGATWQPVTLERVGASTYRSIVNYPELGYSTGQVSLRAVAQDSGGSRIEQTIVGAYGLR